VAFSANCLSKMKDFSRLQAATFVVKVKVLSKLSQKWRKTETLLLLLFYFVLSRPRSEGWPHCGQSVSIVDARPLAASVDLA